MCRLHKMIPVSTTNKTSGDDNNDKMLKKI